MKININKNTSIDLSTLIDTRLLVQANSGGGKSWLLRRILEQSHGKTQQIILDLEGEFSTLREKYDYILAGKNGDIAVDIKTSGLLARKLLELNVSAIIDLYELNHYDRKEFVKQFLTSMVNAPKDLWHPCLVVIDEAHVFCPEKGQSVAAEAVIDLATRGRKRGYCAILATQRLSKLHKDAAAECNNKLIGRTGLDVDMKRASEELGFTTKEQYLSLRQLKSGEFFAFGAAISREVIKLEVGEVETTHPSVGSRVLVSKPIPPTEKIKSVLGKLTDLPQEAKEEASTIGELTNQVTTLKRELFLAKKQQPIPSQEQIQKSVDIALNRQKIEFQNEIKRYLTSQHKLESFIRSIIEKGASVLELPQMDLSKSNGMATGKPTESVRVAEQPIQRDRRLPQLGETNQIQPDFSNGNKPITGGALRMLQVLSSRYPMIFTKSQLATLSKLSPRSGTYGTYLSLLKTNNCIEQNGDQISITQEGLEIAGEQPKDQQDTIAMWRNNLTGGAQRMFDCLVENHPQVLTKEELGERTGLVSNSGTFGTYLSMLRSNGLIEVSGGKIKASENLYL